MNSLEEKAAGFEFFVFTIPDVAYKVWIMTHRTLKLRASLFLIVVMDIFKHM